MPILRSSQKERKARGPLGNVIELIVTVAVAIGLALLIQAVLVKPYRIPSGSMIPTLSIGQRILVNRLATHPGLGDVVVFHPPVGATEGDGVCGDSSQGGGHAQACDKPTLTEASTTFVKRVVGLPGDHIKILDGHVYRNGVEERGSYVQACTTGPSLCNFPDTITIPPGYYFMMGDNRGDSLDSRFWGPIPQKYIIGEAFFTYWPLSRIGLL
jgi:signal peptidase I